jgi:hypothetical protein
VASLLWFVAALVVACFVHDIPPSPPLQPPVDERSVQHETSAAVGIAPVSSVVEVVDESFLDAIYTRDGDGIPSMIVTTPTTNSDNNNHASAHHCLGIYPCMSYQADFNDDISTLGNSVIGPSIRHPLYQNGEEKNDDTGVLGHYAAVTACYLYNLSPGSYSSHNLMYYEDHLVDTGSVVVQNNDTVDDRDDGDSFRGMYYNGAGPAAADVVDGPMLDNKDLLVPSFRSSYINQNNGRQDEEEQENPDSMCSRSINQIVGSHDYDEDDERVGVELATTFASNENNSI